MINSVTVTNDRGESLYIELRSPGNSGLLIKDISGLGPAKATINMSESLYQDGGYFNSARATFRNIVFNFGFFETESESIEDVRLKTYRYFPVKKPITISIDTDTRSGMTTGYVESNEPNIFSKESGAQVSIVCPETVFYSSNWIDTIFSGVENQFEFPFENPSLTVNLIVMSTLNTSSVKSVLYLGDEETGITARIHALGSITDPVIYNNTTAQKMKLLSSKIISIVGSGIQANDDIVITTQRNNKTVTLVRGTTSYNIINALTTDSSWIKIIPGDNLLTYDAAANVGNLQFMVQHKRLYGGM